MTVAAVAGVKKSVINVILRNFRECFRAIRNPISLITKFSEVVGASSRATDSEPSLNPVAVAEVDPEGLSAALQYANFTIPAKTAITIITQERSATNKSKRIAKKVIINIPSKSPIRR